MIAALGGELRVEMHAHKTDVIKWMFGFWAVSLLTTVGAIATLARLVP